MDKGVYGACYYYLNEIVIDKESFIKLSHENREELVWHEFGHCALKIYRHTATGIMKPAGLHDPVYYRIFYSFLMNDLFQSRVYINIQYDPSKYMLLKRGI